MMTTMTNGQFSSFDLFFIFIFIFLLRMFLELRQEMHIMATLGSDSFYIFDEHI
jgi:hypothetical protein